MSTRAQGAPDGGFVGRLATVWRQAGPGLRRRLITIYALLIGFNALIWAILLVSSAKYAVLLGLAPVAFGFGLRHAVDPDHIAAIDNTTRKLMQDGQRPVAVGFFFSLGHSTVVFALSVVVAISAAFVKKNLPQMQNVGGVIGTTVSGVFLVVIAVINLIVLIDTSDGIAMLGAYGWAYIKPVRKLYYNMSITAISIAIALLIGGIELLQVLIQEMGLKGGVWGFIGNTIDISNWGFYIIGAFLLGWIVSMAYYKLRRVDRMDDELPRASAGGAPAR